ncbi:uncharacterized protein LOC126683294 [Mercurialis annua]|uniref:uncharacterized protein LOC126683294 n=1 Tax=Mercurialis annua TaxID=3986 RepID=UPI002160B312|nr:uncharacterized protein LOC126683294 [Mercurialis annua]XP_050235101.1 uncharacterized protein LOC126683294 [Mercurialis annua]XP_050235102.1 uncharacterized protein LOC126683294 [Mercurialis annua]
MRRQGQYGDHHGADTYTGGAHMQHLSSQRMENRPESDHFQGRLEAFTPEREQHFYPSSKVEGQWRWERDESKMSHPLPSQIFAEGQGVDATRSYFQRKGPGQDAKLALEKQGTNDPRFGPREDNMQIGFEDKPLVQNFEGIEHKFLDDIMKLAKDQNDAEDAENVRHREKISAINTQYQEQLEALRARHASRRDEFLHKESQARQHQYQQSMMGDFPSSGMVPSDPHGYSAGAPSAVTNEAHRAYATDQFDSYREPARVHGGSRDQGFEARGPYPGGRVYETGRRYY